MSDVKCRTQKIWSTDTQELLKKTEAGQYIVPAFTADLDTLRALRIAISHALSTEDQSPEYPCCVLEE